MIACPRCKQTLTPGDFYRNATRPRGVSYLCKACSQDEARRIYAQYVAAGLCGCGRRRAPGGYLSCAVCRAAGRRRTGSKPWRSGGRGRPPGVLA
jgi:hypothetical protein